MHAKMRGGNVRNSVLGLALSILLAGGLIGVDRAGRGASAQTDADALANHPIVGVWLVTTPIGPSLAVFSADGTNIQGVTTAQTGPQGVTFTGAQVGTWEPDGDRRVHFTGVQLHTDANGAFTGSVTIDAYPVVSEDGQTIIDDAPETKITIRDATNNVVDVISPNPGSPPATGVRMGVGSPGFAAGASGAATPAAATDDAAATDADLLRTTERDRLRAFVDADLNRLERLHTDDFQLINPGGGALTKEEYLGGIASGEIDYLVWDPDPAIDVRLYDEAAVLRYQADAEIVVGGETIVVRN